MRRFVLLLSLVVIAVPLFAQAPSRRTPRRQLRSDGAEASIRFAAEQLANDKKSIERDVAVLRHLRAADAALVDAMQPANALQKAYEEVSEARRLAPDFAALQGVITLQQALADARRSPGAADFGHLRSLLRTDALGPASRVVVHNALRLQEESVAWLKIQQLIGDHLRALSDLSSDSLRASEEQ
ncbi:MAG TPA: hypothetical protein VN605_13380 [Thermoanaerobaculia bacterium]|nr:hypothetical protein [Thermoanaerobaculia bacterium]